MRHSASVPLPGGAWRGTACHREALVHAISGADQMALLELDHSASQAARVTLLLARCVERVGTIAGEEIEDVVRRLTVGDREALLLRVRQLTFGDRMECVLECPACGTPLELVLSAEQLLLPPYPTPQEWYEAEATDAVGVRYRARCRVPTGVDQEAVAALATADTPTAADALLARCTDDVWRDDARLDTHDEIAACLAERIDDLISTLDPQAELELDVACAACGHAFSTSFDTAAYLFRELEERGRDLYHEIHVLASQYHWSESDILAMSPGKRTRYLELVAGSAPAGASA